MVCTLRLFFSKGFYKRFENDYSSIFVSFLRILEQVVVHRVEYLYFCYFWGDVYSYTLQSVCDSYYITHSIISLFASIVFLHAFKQIVSRVVYKNTLTIAWKSVEAEENDR